MHHTVVIGTAFVDIKGFPYGVYDPHGRNPGSVAFVHGGVGRNVAENIANVGMPVSFVGMMEDSPIGRDVQRRLQGRGVDLSHTLIVPDDGIGMWLVILDEHGDLAGSISKMPHLSHLEAYLHDHLESVIAQTDSVILELDMSDAISKQTLALSQKHGKKVYGIVGNLSVILEDPDLLSGTACFICNEVEADKLFPAHGVLQMTAEQMRDLLPEMAQKLKIPAMVVTMGSQGAAYYDGQERGVCPAIPTQVVDTSGAGDAFFSGTVMALERGMPLSEAVHYGTILAAQTIQSNENTCPIYPLFDRIHEGI